MTMTLKEKWGRKMWPSDSLSQGYEDEPPLRSNSKQEYVMLTPERYEALEVELTKLQARIKQLEAALLELLKTFEKV